MNRFIITALWITGVILLSKGFYMDAKASVAQWLIASSWIERSSNEMPIKPWSWADTRAVAELKVPRLNSHMPASSPLSENGHVVIAGHRDSHFSFLKNIQKGDLISTEHYLSNKQHYRVTDLFIIDTREQQISIYDHAQLTLITCYPFEGFIPGGPLRLVVNAEPISITDLAAN